MFSAVEMKRLSVVVLERDERAVLRGLGALGAVHLVRTGAGPDTAPQDPPDRSDSLARCDDLLGRIDTIGRGGGLLLAPAHVLQPDTPWENVVAFFEAVREFGCH